MSELIVLRHGRTEANASGLLLGRLDPELDELGVRQADAAVAAICATKPVDRVISSPLRRTRQTAEAFGVAVTFDERFIELDYGEFDGRPAADVPPETWAKWRADLDFRPPGGESLRELGVRVRTALDELVVESSGVTVVVTHVSPIKAALAWGLGVGDEISWRSYVQPASIMRFNLRGGQPSLAGFNDTAHLAGLA